MTESLQQGICERKKFAGCYTMVRAGESLYGIPGAMPNSRSKRKNKVRNLANDTPPPDITASEQVSRAITFIRTEKVIQLKLSMERVMRFLKGKGI